MHIVLTNRTASELESIKVAKNEAAEIGGRKISYMLLEIRLKGSRVHAVAICEDSYSELLTLTKGQKEAKRLYRTVRDGEVTPCELKDIAEDLGFSELGNSLKMTLC